MTPFKLLVLSIILLVAGFVWAARAYRPSGSGVLIPALMAIAGSLGILIALVWGVVLLF